MKTSTLSSANTMNKKIKLCIRGLRVNNLGNKLITDVHQTSASQNDVI